MFGWLKKKSSEQPPAQSQAYQRQENKSLRAFYKPYADYFDQTPQPIAGLIEKLAKRINMPATTRIFPTSTQNISQAADAFAEIFNATFGTSITLANPDGNQNDRIADYLVDPKVRPFFQDGRRRELSEAEQEGYAKALEELRLPKEPLLYYAWGSFYCMWLIQHRQATLCLYDPLELPQSFPDMISSRLAVGLLAFSHVAKRLTDPEGDNLEFKSIPRTSQIPPHPILASVADLDFAIRQLLPEAGREALDAEGAHDFQTAMRFYEEAVAQDPDNARLLAYASSCALQQEQYSLAVNLMRRILQKYPNFPAINHNLAVIYSGSDMVNEAIELLELAIQVDPYYARARITLASCFHDLGRKDEALQHLDWVIENDGDLKEEALAAKTEFGYR